MLKGQKILAVVPARGGSKGIPLKNLQPVMGVPLVALAGRVIAELPEIDRAVVSTDHEEIARVAEEAGIAAPFRRPEALSGDRIGDVDVLTHALEATEAVDGQQYDIVLMLQPTSPLRRSEHVRGCLNLLVDGGWDAVWTVSETDSKAHPLKQLTVGKTDDLDFYDPAAGAIVARQQLTPVYHRNGIAYAIRRECLMVEHTLKGRRTGALIVEGPHVSIDTPFDLELVEWLASRS